MKFLIFIFLSIPLLFFSQSSHETGLKAHFFDFDQVDHYSLKISPGKISEMEFKNQKTDALFLAIIRGNYPEKTDASIEQALTDHGFDKQTLNKALYSELNAIFSEKGCSDHIGGGFCIPTFRDILVFRKDDKVAGIVKLCYECRFAILKGTEKNVRNFGSCGDFLKLGRLLERNLNPKSSNKV